MAMTGIRTVDEASNFEDFDDEIVIINNQSGVFYSLRGRAMNVWRACLPGIDSALLDERLREIDEEEQHIIRGMITEFIDNGLFIRTEELGSRQAMEDWLSAAPANFERNDDFDDLIKLDPIHDVGDQGWPGKDNSSK